MLDLSSKTRRMKIIILPATLNISASETLAVFESLSIFISYFSHRQTDIAQTNSFTLIKYLKENQRLSWISVLFSFIGELNAALNASGMPTA